MRRPPVSTSVDYSAVPTEERRPSLQSSNASETENEEGAHCIRCSPSRQLWTRWGCCLLLSLIATAALLVAQEPYFLSLWNRTSPPHAERRQAPPGSVPRLLPSLPLLSPSSPLPSFDVDVCPAVCHWPRAAVSTALSDSDDSAADLREFVYPASSTAGMDDFVCASNFRDLADYVVSWPFHRWGEPRFIDNSAFTPFTSDISHCLLPGAIVYAQGHNCAEGARVAAGQPSNQLCSSSEPCMRLFSSDSPLQSPVILLTGQSDYSARQFCGLALDPNDGTEQHPLLVHWWGQNGDIHGHPAFSALPIGILCFTVAASLRRALVHGYTADRLQQCWPQLNSSAWLETVKPAVHDFMMAEDKRRKNVQRSPETAAESSLYWLLHLDHYNDSTITQRIRALNREVNLEMHRMGHDDNYTDIGRVLDETRGQRDQAVQDQNCSEALRQLITCDFLYDSLSSALPSHSLPPSSSDDCSSPSSIPVPVNIANALTVARTGIGQLAVANFGSTHPRREEIRRALCQPSTTSWLHCLPMAPDGDMEEQYRTLSGYLYWLSPRGNGLESRRTWEALYMGCVPVLERSEITAELFDDGDLPVLLVDDLTLLTKETLVANLPRFLHLTLDFPRRTLLLHTWKQRILRQQREWRRSALTPEQRANQDWGREENSLCWGAMES